MAAAGEVSKYRQYSDDNLVVEGGVSASIEMMRRLQGAIAAQERSSTALGVQLRQLNVWLLVVTVAIGALTLVQVLAALRVIGR
jgi:hypothetical protein